VTAKVRLAAVLVALAAAGGWLRCIDARLDRASTRAEHSWARLDAALVHRAQVAAEVVRSGGMDPAGSVLVFDAAGLALQPHLPHPEREQAESTLTHVLALVDLPGLRQEQQQASLARRLHNDAIATLRTLRRRPAVRLLRLAGGQREPVSFEMAEDRRLSWSGDRAR